jgi:hypothetical protein
VLLDVEFEAEQDLEEVLSVDIRELEDGVEVEEDTAFDGEQFGEVDLSQLLKLGPEEF